MSGADLRNLFAVVFAIYFATVVATAGRFHPFDSSAAVAGDRFALRRIGLGILFLNILPFVYFVYVWRLVGIEGMSRSWWMAPLSTLFAGLAPFGFYRLFVGAMLVRRAADKSLFKFYATSDDLKDPQAKLNAGSRQPPEPHGIGACRVALGGVVWLAACGSLFGVFWLLS